MYLCCPSLPDVLTNELVSLTLVGPADRRSVLLLDEKEKLAVHSEAEFCQRLGCDSATAIKVVSIVGKDFQQEPFFLFITIAGTM
jgi:hypothetical protein